MTITDDELRLVAYIAGLGGAISIRDLRERETATWPLGADRMHRSRLIKSRILAYVDQQASAVRITERGRRMILNILSR